jgi:signal transduction histidine kinase
MPVMEAASRDDRRRRLAAIVAASFVPGLIDATHALARGARVEPSYFVFETAGTLGLLAVLTVTFDRCMRRRVAVAPLFAVMTVAGVALGVAVGFAGWALGGALDLPLVAPPHRSAVVVARMGAIEGVLGLGLWAMAVFLPFAVRDAQARAVEAERLRASAELARLRANLQPHFLFNTLSTVAGLVGEDPREARKLIGALGDLLRDSLAEADEMQTLEDEVSWLKRYAGILETRHRGSLVFRWDIDEATRSVRIPRLLLQPLLENAVKHGALRRPEGGEVAVRTTLDAGGQGRVTCIVEDNGPGPASRATRPGALGIHMVTRRLALRYAGAAAFRLESGGGRTRSIVEIPAEAAS